MEWLKNLWEGFMSWGEKELEFAGNLFGAGIKQFASEFGPAVLQAAATMVPVMAAAMTGASGADKQKAAAIGVGVMLDQQGIQVGVHVATSTVNLAIEHAYAELQQKSLPTPAPNPEPAPVQEVLP